MILVLHDLIYLYKLSGIFVPIKIIFILVIELTLIKHLPCICLKIGRNCVKTDMTVMLSPCHRRGNSARTPHHLKALFSLSFMCIL